MSLLQQIADAGVVGCGGAGFPTDLKYGGEVEHLIINAAECEPLLQTDKYLVRSFADRIVRGICAVKGEFNIPACTIALKAEYVREIAALEKAIDAESADIRIFEMDSFYPAGDEQTMVFEVTGRIVPPGKIPASVGCVVDNVGTMLAVSDALDGKPLCEKYVTVAGETAESVIVKTPVGTPVSRCIEAAGGANVPDYTVVIGGPMMGRRFTREEAEKEVVTKTTSGILVFRNDGENGKTDLARMINRAKSCCIQCSTCTQLCPRSLLGHPLAVHKIMRAVSHCEDLEELLESPVIRNARLCCECGVCEEYACPMGLAPRRINTWLKKELNKHRIPPEPAACETAVDLERDYRKIPTKRLVGRLGLAGYARKEISGVVTLHPDTVEIPLEMHIGPAAEPAVAVGQHVLAGELIARRPAPGKGANIHTGVSGTVVSVGERIVIRA